MIKFLDIIDSYILILNKELQVIYCNKKVLKKLECYIDETNNMKVEIISHKEELNRLLNQQNEGIDNVILQINKKIELECSIIYQEFEGRDAIFVSSNDFKVLENKCNNDGKVFEKHMNKEILGSQESIDIINYIIDKVKDSTKVKEIFNKENIVKDLENIIQEIHKLEYMKKDFTLLISISADLIGAFNKNGDLKLVNQPWSHYFGWSEEELLQSNILSLVEECFKEELIKILNTNKEDVYIIENRFKCKNGKYKWLRWNIKYVKERDMFATTIRDISKEKKEILTREKLEESIQLESIKNEFFANMSHEFKTPLNIILGTAQLLDKKINDNKITLNEEIYLSKYIDLIRQNSYRLLKLINNLIDMTKIENEYYEIKLGNYNIVSVVEDIILSVAEYVQQKSINIIFDTNCEEEFIACDPEKIERILLNILSNAIKHTSENGWIHVYVEVKKDRVIISIEDNGEGISEEKLPIIFNRFVQGDSSLTRSYEGSGIGLSLVKSLVEMHEGKINIDSKKGKGTKVAFCLPNKTTTKEYNINKKIKDKNNKIEMCSIEFSDIYEM